MKLNHCFRISHSMMSYKKPWMSISKVFISVSEMLVKILMLTWLIKVSTVKLELIQKLVSIQRGVKTYNLIHCLGLKLKISYHHHHHHHIAIMELGHLLTLSGLTHPEVVNLMKFYSSIFWRITVAKFWFFTRCDCYAKRVH